MIEFYQAKILDRLWWKKLTILLDQLEAQNVLKLIELQHQQNAAAINYQNGKEAFDHHWNIGKKNIMDVKNLLFPWLRKETAPEEQAIKSLRDEWVANFGDPSDPETQKRIQATVDDLMGSIKAK